MHQELEELQFDINLVCASRSEICESEGSVDGTVHTANSEGMSEIEGEERRWPQQIYRSSYFALERFHANISTTRVARLRGGSMLNKVKHEKYCWSGAQSVTMSCGKLTKASSLESSRAEKFKTPNKTLCFRRWIFSARCLLQREIFFAFRLKIYWIRYRPEKSKVS